MEIKEKKYNKLVRDRIPEIIKQSGGIPTTRILDDEEFIKELNLKLCEEVQEYLEDESIEELADILEVIHGILRAKKTTFQEVENIRIKKAQERGAFDKRIFLEKVDKE